MRQEEICSGGVAPGSKPLLLILIDLEFAPLVVESHGIILKESGLAEQSQSLGFQPQSESSVGGKSADGLKRCEFIGGDHVAHFNPEIIVVGYVAAIANASGDLLWHGEWIEPERDGEGNRKNALVRAGIRPDDAGDGFAAMAVDSRHRERTVDDMAIRKGIGWRERNCSVGKCTARH